MEARSQEPAAYSVPREQQNEDDIIASALRILESRMRAPGELLSNPRDVKMYLRLRLAALEHEVFQCLFLDTQNRLIASVEMFRGSINSSPVYPREVAKEALRLNASAVVFAHNHPSGHPEPSTADIEITKTLKTALEMIEVRVLDHIIVAGNNTYSFAERGLI